MSAATSSENTDMASHVPIGAETSRPNFALGVSSREIGISLGDLGISLKEIGKSAPEIPIFLREIHISLRKICISPRDSFDLKPRKEPEA